MASSVFYKWASRKDESRVTFDGTGISVFELKREIIIANGLNKANDFDLHLYDATSKQEYKDDSYVIPRSSSVIVKRLPLSRPGKSKIAMYVAGTAPIPTSDSRAGPHGAAWHKGAMSKRFDGKDEASTANAARSSSGTPALLSSITKEDEAAAVAAMFKAQSENWEEAQEKMSHATRIYTNPRGTGFPRGGKPFSPHAPPNDRPLPPSYVCYRCGQKGHWIQDCPTNNDREFDHRPRIKRTTGIPRSMLKAVETPSSGELGQGVMVTPEGGYVVAQPDVAAWQKQVSRSKGLTSAEVREKAPSDPSLACPIDHKLFRDAVKTPCCGTVYCEECIQTHLLERDFVCPNCSKKIASLDKLVADKPTRTKVSDYIEKAIEESRKEGAEDGGSRNGDNIDPNDPQALSTAQLEQDFYTDQSGLDMDMQMLVDSIPQLQAQIAQISVMLQNPSLPNQVRMQTEMQHQQLQMQLQQAQNVALTLAAAASFQQAAAQAQAEAAQQQQQQQQQLQQMQQQMQNGGYGVQNWGAGNNPGDGNLYGQQGGQEGAYQRLPVNNRRRNLKRERPSDFLEVGGDEKVPRYWE
ncbi:hypothetical protein AX16_001712 [Volvariella volvacea WC 439]|nr:hypothetical protein AX16_001712 [Volvariella volvacea WC 439]